MVYGGHPDQKLGHITYSQNGEDFVIVNLFKQLGIDKPTYLDIGAHHPYTISNTALLYSRGSRGVNVDANPNNQALFLKERPEDVNLFYAVSADENVKEGAFYMVDQWSGRNSCDLATLNEYLSESGRPLQKTIPVPMITINRIIDEYCDGKWPDFLNLDVEGWEYDVLNSCQFGTFWASNPCPIIICVESRKHNTEKIKWLLDAFNYSVVCRMGENLIFLDDEYASRLDWFSL